MIRYQLQLEDTTGNHYYFYTFHFVETITVVKFASQSFKTSHNIDLQQFHNIHYRKEIKKV